MVMPAARDPTDQAVISAPASSGLPFSRLKATAITSAAPNTAPSKM